MSHINIIFIIILILIFKFLSNSNKKKEHFIFDNEINSIPIYVINLEHRTDRKKHMEKLLTDIGFINYQFIVPIKVTDDYRKKWIEEKRITQNLDKINNNKLSRLLTFIRILKNAEYDKFIIMEDDIINYIPINEIQNTIENILKQLPIDCDMFYMEYCTEDCKNRQIYNDYLYKLYAPYCLGSVMFTHNSSNKILDLLETHDYNSFKPYTDNIINYLIKNGYINAYASNPMIFEQNPLFGSDLPGSRRSNVPNELLSQYRNNQCRKVIPMAYQEVIRIKSLIIICIIICCITIKKKYLFNK